jgi:hypothetical protein
MKSVVFFLLSLLIGALPSQAWATSINIDFATAVPIDSNEPIDGFRTRTYLAGGIEVTFSGYNLFYTSCCFGITGLTTQGIGAYPMAVLFSEPVNWVQFRNPLDGTYTWEVKYIRGVAYDDEESVLDEKTTGGRYLRLEGPFIQSILYDPVNMNGMVIAEFTFESSPRIPEPSAIALIIFGLVGVGLLRRNVAVLICSPEMPSL